MYVLDCPMSFFRHLHVAAFSVCLYTNMISKLSSVVIFMFSRFLAVVRYISFALNSYMRPFIRL